jgi:hypothetical protein
MGRGGRWQIEAKAVGELVDRNAHLEMIHRKDGQGQREKICSHKEHKGLKEK